MLVDSEEAGVHLAVSEDGFRIVYFQGHPEYDSISLLKEFKREVIRYFRHEREDYPVFPDNYLHPQAQAILGEFREKLEHSREQSGDFPEFPEAVLIPLIDNTWHDTAEAVLENWVGKVYQLTSMERKIPFMDGVNPENPLNWTP